MSVIGDEMDLLNKDEKEAVIRTMNQKPGLLATFLENSVYIIPSLAMALYGLFKGDFLASLVAYGVLLGIVVFYLVYSEKYSKTLRSALEKYEEEVKAL